MKIDPASNAPLSFRTEGGSIKNNEKGTQLNVSDRVSISGKKSDEWTLTKGIRGALAGVVKGVKEGINYDIKSDFTPALLGAGIGLLAGVFGAVIGGVIGASAPPLFLGAINAVEGFAKPESAGIK